MKYCINKPFRVSHCVLSSSKGSVLHLSCRVTKGSVLHLSCRVTSQSSRRS